MTWRGRFTPERENRAHEFCASDVVGNRGDPIVTATTDFRVYQGEVAIQHESELAGWPGAGNKFHTGASFSTPPPRIFAISSPTWVFAGHFVSVTNSASGHCGNRGRITDESWWQLEGEVSRLAPCGYRFFADVVHVKAEGRLVWMRTSLRVKRAVGVGEPCVSTGKAKQGLGSADRDRLDIACASYSSPADNGGVVCFGALPGSLARSRGNF